jgi:hypothetical protein
MSLETAIWVDLGFVGHKSKRLTEIYRGEYLVDVPIQNSLLNFTDYDGDKFVVFIDYTVGGSGETGTKVFTNAFNTPLQFYKDLSEKLIKEYVEINQSLDFKQNF